MNDSVCVHCGCVGGVIYGKCIHCTPQEYVNYILNHGKNKIEHLRYALSHYEDYCTALTAYNKNLPKDMKPMKIYSEKWVKRLLNKEEEYEKIKNEYKSLRIIRRDVKVFMREFNLPDSVLTLEVPKNKEHIEWMLNKHVYLFKYYTNNIKMYNNKRDHIRHEYRLQGIYKHIVELLGKTCGIRAQGCRVPIFIPTEFK